MSEIPQTFMKKYFEINPDYPGKRVCISALPGIGMTGKAAIDHLIKQLKPKKYVEIYTTDFPSHIIINDDGTILTPCISIHYLQKVDNGNLEIFLVTGDTQPNSVIGTNTLSNKIVQLLVDCGVSLIISLAATPVISPKKKPKVYLTFSSESILQGFLDAGVKNKFVKGTITGMNGVIPGIAKSTYNIEGVVLLSETYPQFVRDMNASVSLINVLINYLGGLTVDVSELEEQAQKTIDLYDKMRQRQREKRLRKGARDLGYIS
ncbi:MAG: PAC2 family protein [Candidatus Helarchaeota archaeon]|nr:PAC2 family protein [Candidatus Helarchaeota archaeon]